MNRRYFSFDIVLVSSLSLGSGLNENTDSDVLLDSRDKPYIPATSIAGVLASRLGKEDKERLCGKISDNGDNKQSHVIFYDALYAGESEPVISVRNSVHLIDKVGEDGAKFDFEIVESGVRFRTYIELDDSVSADDEKLFLSQLAALNSGILRFGHKTTRGYGQVRLENVRRLAFDDISKWLRFDMYDDDCWTGAETFEPPETGSDTDIIELELELKSALSIRSYTTEIAADGEPTAPDFKYLSLRNGKPVIPGTTWAGVFRDGVARLLGVNKMTDAKMQELFGYVEQGTKITQKSKITFSESVFEDGTYEKKLITRNSIDRFSAATNDGALYTELTIYSGKTSLIVTLPKGTDIDLKTALLAAFADLDNGFIAVGGLTSVGRGLFEIKTLRLNGEDMTDKFKAYDLKDIFGGEQD
ncbi:RAMP superfamily CRISPR-associated protein [Ruminococcus albus]|uniref:CRISPR-associated RAMP protein n=1 Tax=Ruminococcus albus 8 TaxID=246199 RepID=E9S9I7_RUMAL|nr:RAMP superfamily CRISPR-associated protein [Ruminococcus albus]EGC04079.1 CRISPR-associated RAMP protein [Ruminococcus albus 8]MCC3350665.1 RAMP superfamily CRISPR-associated protein [Ruminococcus albus 8]